MRLSQPVGIIFDVHITEARFQIGYYGPVRSSIVSLGKSPLKVAHNKEEANSIIEVFRLKTSLA